MTYVPGQFHSLQQVKVREEEVLGYVKSMRPNCVGMEYYVMYWQDGKRGEGWFPESELEAA